MEYTEQASVTDWPMRLLLVGIFLALILIALYGMRRGWRARIARQQDLPAPLQAPPPGWTAVGEVQGMYVGTVRAGDWLDRIAAHGLGVRSRAVLHWSRVDGVLAVWCEREGAPSIFIPVVEAVGQGRGIAGTVRSTDSVWILRWALGDEFVETGFRATQTSDHDALAAAWGVDVHANTVNDKGE